MALCVESEFAVKQDQILHAEENVEEHAVRQYDKKGSIFFQSLNMFLRVAHAGAHVAALSMEALLPDGRNALHSGWFGSCSGV